MEKSEFKKETYDLIEELNIHLEEETERSRKEKLEKEKAEILAYKEQLEALIKGAKLPRKEAWEKLLGITNYAGIQSAADATGCFQQIVLFMNNSNLKIPIIATPLINMDRLDQFWKTAKNQGTEEVPSVDFKIDGKEYTLIVTHINEAFGTTVAENESFADLANDDTLSKFFLYIGYAGLVPDKNSTKWYPTSEMNNRYMRKEWNMLFDAMVKIFSTKTSGWNGIPSYIKKLTHSMVHGYKVNVGKVVMAQLRSSISKKVHVYPRFVTMLLNHICDIVENAPNMKECFVLKNNTQTSLIL
ncbi:hypothetical protein ACET3Z_028264 [Daucus carota]